MEQKTNVVLLTSRKGGVGCSEVAAALARAFASLGKKTLAIDLCSGNPTLDLLLDVSESVVYDCSDVLDGRIDPRRALQRPDDESDLWLLPGSCRVREGTTGAELIRFLSTVDEAAECEVIVVDCPPEVATILSEVSDTVLAVTDLSLASLRATANLTFAEGTDCRLVVNRYAGTDDLGDQGTTVLEALDMTGFPLAGVFLSDPALSHVPGGKPKSGGTAGREITLPALNTAKRVLGMHAPLFTGYLRGKKRRALIRPMARRHTDFRY